MSNEPVVSAQTRELASRIYVDLALRSCELNGSAVKMQASPENLAKLSFKLAAAFDGVERELNSASLPKNQDYKVDIASIASWSAPVTLPPTAPSA
jgi:hypothetical protein